MMEESKKEKITAGRRVGKFLLGCLLLVLMIAGIEQVSRLLRPDAKGLYRETFRGFYSEDKNSLDVIAVGSSAFYRYINNPRIWEHSGITSFNLCTGSMPVGAMRFVIEEAQKTQKPAVYLIDSRCFLQNGKEWVYNDLHRITDSMRFSLTRLKLIAYMIPDILEWPEYVLDLISYHDNWKKIKKEEVLDYLSGDSQELKGWKNIFRLEKNGPIPQMEADLEPVSLEEDLEKELRLLLQSCEKKNIRLLFLHTPWYISQEDAMQDLSVRSIVEEYGQGWLDMNPLIEELQLDAETDFYNRRHVNALGSLKVSDYLGDYLLEQYDLPTEHNEKTVREWDEAVSLNNLEIEQALEAGFPDQMAEEPETETETEF